MKEFDQKPRVSRAVLIGGLVIAVTSCGVGLLLLQRGADSDRRGRQSVQSRPVGAAVEAPARSTVTPSADRVLTDAAARVEPATPAVRPAPPALVQLPEPTPYSRQLVGALCRLDQPSIPQTQEQVAEWKQNLQQLIAQGPAAVAAIREFLDKNVDLVFGPGNALGYASARAALFDAMVQIGGAEALAGTLQTLQITADPREIAVLAQNLEKLAPGAYRQEALEAAREALAMATSGKLDGADVAPLFEVLNKLGDTSVVTDLVQAAKQWNYYSAIALAQLPDGTGIPTLIEMAQSASGGRLNAIEMLAQMSTEYPEARAALIEQVGRISANMWPYLTPLLAGDLYHYRDSAFDSPVSGGHRRSNSAHVRMGNQHFYTAPAAEVFAPDEIKQRLALLDELQAMTADPAAHNALDQARESLRMRDPQMLAVSPGG